MRLFAVLLLIATGAFTSAVAQPRATPPILIRAGKFYDSEQQRFLLRQDILIQNGVIRAVGRALPTPKNARVIDLRRHTVTPGLIDAHTHFLIHQKQVKTGLEDASKVPAKERLRQGMGFARENLVAGITTVRDVGNSGQFLDIELRKRLAGDPARGPRMLVSGPIMSPPGGQFGRMARADSFVINQEYRVIRSAADARAAVLAHAQRGVDVIKVCMNTDNRVLAPDEIKAIVTTAREKGIPVTAHATYDESARDAVLAGVDGIEHGYVLTDSTLRIMAQRNAYVVPTDVSRQRGRLMVAGIGMTGKEAEDYLNSNLDAFHDRLRRAVRLGVTIVSGADFYNDVKGIKRGEGAVDVVLSYHEAGLPPAAVLRFATYNAAKALRIADKVGSLKPGMQADLVIFAEDMENNFARSLTNVVLVMRAGKIVYQRK